MYVKEVATSEKAMQYKTSENQIKITIALFISIRKTLNIKESSVINGLLYFHSYVSQNYLKVDFAYSVSPFSQHTELIRQK